ncbi:cytochrome P450 [Streptomyces caniscabiei]|uniref:Cytochrome P450 n=1 Tax=Streptomyces caniscabiei TaxID=2746961 RepID=A0ABU4N832_9ACTN|nr:cytochrome P450 [Streptomyces caniscabiei]MBE4741997.1 cytochrome P450 [Streptomyces caniscabiei]MBE4762033.1 cytochrome P450 [Streptomyces caniscabiei]MBE4776025.1 cytochrome P450 [Streptomyces caniscabiei]MBE4790817.1 cytochrome P450 [Streptomyces caniscabiei]MBE4800005.1 cytochrome P450 [Streptomyces caniscabiei]
MTSPAQDTWAPDGGAAGHGLDHGFPHTGDPLGPLGPLGPLDLFGDTFVRDPYPWLDLLRSEAPVHHDPITGLWLISRHHDVRQVLLDPDVFLPDNAQHSVTPLPVAVLRVLARGGFSLPPALANNGSPTHAGLRRVVTRFFHANRVADAVPVIERIADELLVDEVRSRIDSTGDCDLFTSFAQLLPCRVLMELLGIRGVEPATLIRWSDASLELFWGRPTPERQLELAKLVVDFHQWLTATVRGGMAASDSFIGALARHRLPDGGPLDVETAVGVCFFVFIAGQSTTGQLITTVLRRAMAESGMWLRVAGEAGLAEAWVEEVLRREPPVTTWRRVTAQSTELSGVRLPAGAQVLVMLLGSGSDPEVFPSPERMCPHRENIRHHLAFGAGRHRCPGASLARTEAAVALRAAARRLPDIRPAAGAGEPPMLGLLSFRAPLKMVVE